MKFTEPEVFGLFHLYDLHGRGRRGGQIVTLCEAYGTRDKTHERYLKALSILGLHGTEVTRARLMHGTGTGALTVAAQHEFFLPCLESTVLQSIEGDGDSHTNPDGLHITFERKVSLQHLQVAEPDEVLEVQTGVDPVRPLGDLALEYDLLIAPRLRVIDVRGERQHSFDYRGQPSSVMPPDLVANLCEALEIPQP